MSSLQFEVVGRGRGLPNRRREVFGNCLTFESGELKMSVLIENDMARDLRLRATRHRDREVGGLLAGRRFSDSRGQYAIVLGMVQTHLDDGTAQRIELSAERVASLRHQAETDHPAMDIIGWWHSHLRPHGFSSADRKQQGLWSDPLDVGLLVFASGHDWGRAYVGPACHDLPICATAIGLVGVAPSPGAESAAPKPISSDVGQEEASPPLQGGRGAGEAAPTQSTAGSSGNPAAADRSGEFGAERVPPSPARANCDGPRASSDSPNQAPEPKRRLKRWLSAWPRRKTAQKPPEAAGIVRPATDPAKGQEPLAAELVARPPLPAPPRPYAGQQDDHRSLSAQYVLIAIVAIVVFVMVIEVIRILVR